jgi:hypothetical protein
MRVNNFIFVKGLHSTHELGIPGQTGEHGQSSGLS